MLSNFYQIQSFWADFCKTPTSNLAAIYPVGTLPIHADRQDEVHMHISLFVSICLIKIYTRFTHLHVAVRMQNSVFWVITSCKTRFEENMLPLSSTLVMKVVHSSKLMIPTYKTTQCKNPESKSEHDNELHRFRTNVKYSTPVQNSALNFIFSSLIYI
jgi:hypothetical protein